MPKTFPIFIKQYLLISTLFLLVYFPSNDAAANHHTVWHFYFVWEKSIPFIDWMILPYLSITLLLWMPLWYMDINRLKELAKLMVAITLISGLFFWLFPSHIGFVRTGHENSLFYPLYQMLYQLDQPYNALPSLHISYSYAVVSYCTLAASKKHIVFLYSWFVCIAMAVLFTHQHQVLDILTAILLVHGCLFLTQKSIVFTR
ncbi:MAG: phosphatase PAP2 family protein [Mariprofundaceae bacterium]|nr:phosphatase PAP2 family protein [Mariprofundaceae bacterium]